MSTKNTSEVEVLVVEKMATEEQIGHIMDMWRRRLKGRKLTLGEANHLIQNGGQYLPSMDKAADVLIDQLRSDRKNTIVRIVRNIQRGRTAEEAVNATGRVNYVNDSILATMPVGNGPEEVELEYFKMGRYATNEEVEQELKRRGLTQDPQAQMADNEHNPAFADEHPNGCFWDRDGKMSSFATFRRWGDDREVYVDRYGTYWDDHWWFAGARQ